MLKELAMTLGSLWPTFILRKGARGTFLICTEVQQFPEATFRAVTTAKQSQGSGESPI
jgi:hypothetical protein